MTKIDLSVFGKLVTEGTSNGDLATVFGCSKRAITKAKLRLAKKELVGESAAVQTPIPEKGLPFWIATLPGPCVYSEKGFVLRGEIVRAKKRPSKHFELFNGTIEDVKPGSYSSAIIEEARPVPIYILARERAKVGLSL